MQEVSGLLQISLYNPVSDINVRFLIVSWRGRGGGGVKNTQLCMRMACSTMNSKVTSLHAFNDMYECMKTRMTDRHHVNFFQSIWLPQYHVVQSSYLQ